MTISLEEIINMDSRKRGQFINALSGVKSANLVGTKDKNGRENLSIVNSVFHIGSNPPLLGFIQRPTTVERHTYENMVETKQYTFNAIGESFIDKAHQTAARYEKNQSEFEAVGLEPVYKNDFYAPFVAESSLQIAMKLEQIIPIEINQTKLIIGSIQEIHSNIEIQEDGFFDIGGSDIVGIAGLDTYLKTENIARFSYAKPNEELKKR